MTLRDFTRLVNDMRTAQRLYFRNRDSSDLRRSKSLESQVDRVIAEILDDRPSLFPESTEVKRD